MVQGYWVGGYTFGNNCFDVCGILLEWLEGVLEAQHARNGNNPLLCNHSKLRHLVEHTREVDRV